MLSLFSALEISVKAFVADNDYNSALNELREFVVAVMNMQAAPGEVVGARKVDSLCELVGNSFFKTISDSEIFRIAKSDKKRMIVVCTGLYKYGGTTLVIRDLVNAHPEYECTVIATNYLEDMTPDDLELSRIEGSGAGVDICPPGNAEDKLRWLILRFAEISASRIFLLNHHQDSVIISGAAPFVNAADVIFYHHADYNMCLGVHLKGAIHVDPHNVGYYNCRTKEGLVDNAYVPMTVDDRIMRRLESGFLDDVNLTTCSSGHYHKFRNFYLYPYSDLIADRLSIRSGTHVHIGGITEPDLAHIRHTLIKRGLDADRFIHIPWTASFWDKIVDLSVDLFIGSFPIGGARTTIEVMGAGIPLLMPDNYLSRFFSSRDIVYKECYTWRYPEDFSEIINNINASSLKIHARLSRAHYDMYYNGNAIDLEEIINRVCRHDSTLPPYELYDHYPDELDKFMHFKRIDELLSQYAVDVALDQTKPEQDVLPNSIEKKRSRNSIITNSVSSFLKKFTNSREKYFFEKEQKLFNALIVNPEGIGFDHTTYLQKNPDVAEAGLDPLRHFVKHGQYEDRSPSFFFSADWHVEMNKDNGPNLSDVLIHLSQTRSDLKRKTAAFFIYAWNSARLPDAYIREMITALAGAGVNVDVYVGGQFAFAEGTKGFRQDLKKSAMGNYIRHNSYDFALCFNNALIIPEIVSALKCTIVSIMVDSIHHMFDQSDEGINSAFNLPIHVAPIYTSFVEDARSLYHFNCAVSFLPAATITERQELDFDHEQIEISWIASMLGDYHIDNFLSRVDLELPNGLKLMTRCLADIQSTGEISKAPASQDAARILCEWACWDYALLEMHMQEIVTNSVRLQAVERLAPLGLQIYGNPRWRSALMMSPSTVQSFRSGANLRKHSDLCKIYDRSKISINIPQIHAGTGMQYRILDILASKSLLITKHVDNSDMELLFGSDSPIVTFTDIDDLYQKCYYYLNNDEERLARVAACNALVAKGYSFRDRIIDYLTLSNPAQVNKIDGNNGAGSVSLIWPERVINWALRYDNGIK